MIKYVHSLSNFKFSTYTISNLLNNKVTLIAEHPSTPSIINIGILCQKSYQLQNSNIFRSLSLLNNETGDIFSKSQLNGSSNIFQEDSEIIYYSNSCINKHCIIDTLEEMLNNIYKEKPSTKYMNRLLDFKLSLNDWLNEINTLRGISMEGNSSIVNKIYKLDKNENKTKDNKINIDLINQYIKNTKSNNNIICITGISKDDLKSLSTNIEKMLSQLLPSDNNKSIQNIGGSIKYNFNFLLNKSFSKYEVPLNLKIFYPYLSWDNKQLASYSILNELFGEATPFSSGGPGKGLFSYSNNILRDNNDKLLACRSLNFPYKNFGMFGFDFTFNNKKKNNINYFYDLINGFNNFIDEMSFIRSKNILKRKVLRILSKAANRCENNVKQYFYFNNQDLDNNVDIINKVELNDVRGIMKNILDNKNKCAMFINGPKEKVNQVKI